MQQLLAIAAGGAIGSVMRYLVSTGVYAIAGRGFPYGTLTVNIAGSMAMGLLYVLLIDRAAADGFWRMALLVGFLGAFTTFSTFSIETLNLMQGGEFAKAMANILLSVALCIGATWLGIRLGRLV